MEVHEAHCKLFITFLGADVDKLKVKEGGVPGVGAALRLSTHLRQETIGLKPILVV